MPQPAKCPYAASVGRLIQEGKSYSFFFNLKARYIIRFHALVSLGRDGKEGRGFD
jgi:hypothetical protein